MVGAASEDALSVSRLLVGDRGSPVAAAARSWAENMRRRPADVAVARVDDVRRGSSAAGLLA
jgi:hypothetical protein